MRPRSRLSKRSLLLPTIREGTEETLRDLNEAKTLHIVDHGQAVSSEDYLLSICHLAHPTFPTRDVSPNNNPTRQPDAVHHRLRLSRLSGSQEEKDLDGELMFGNADPLEFLYGHQNNLSGGVRRAFAEERYVRQHGSIWEGQARSRAHSTPRASSPDLPRQRKSSCPELQASTSIPHVAPNHNFSRSEARGGRGTDGASPSIKQSLISQWISDCRSAWREARVRACMLPAIAEIQGANGQTL